MAVSRVRAEAFSPAARRALGRLDRLLGERPGWVVGGAVRDALLGHEPPDLDIALPSGALAVGRALAGQGGGTFVALDEGRGVCRVVGEVQVDLADFRAGDLAGDLRGRDFTVNALALSIRELLGGDGAGVEDPTGGLADLAVRRVRACGPRALAEDPVRALRAARLACQPGWALDEALEPAIRETAPAVGRVAAERVRDELVAILCGQRAGAGFRLLDRLDVLGVVFPERAAMQATSQPLPHRFDVWEHSLRALDGMDELEAGLDRLAPWGGELRAHLAEDLGGGLTRGAALKLAALLHDVSKPETRAEIAGQIRFFGHDHIGAARARAIAGRLRLAGRAADVLARLVDHHLRPMHLAQAGEITRRARYRFFRDLGADARDLLLLALADAGAVQGTSPLDVWAGAGGAVVRSLMEGLGTEAVAASAPPLLRGEDVMAAFGLAPGPRVGQLLARAREAQALGLVSTPAEAIAHLRREDPGFLDTPAAPP